MHFPYNFILIFSVACEIMNHNQAKGALTVFDFVIDSPETVHLLTPMEQRATTRNVMAIHLALHSQMTQTQVDAPLTAAEVEAMLLFAAQIVTGAEA